MWVYWGAAVGVGPGEQCPQQQEAEREPLAVGRGAYGGQRGGGRRRKGTNTATGPGGGGAGVGGRPGRENAELAGRQIPPAAKPVISRHIPAV